MSVQFSLSIFANNKKTCRPAPDVYAVRVTTKTPIVLRGEWNWPGKKRSYYGIIVVSLAPHHGTWRSTFRENILRKHNQPDQDQPRLALQHKSIVLGILLSIVTIKIRSYLTILKYIVVKMVNSSPKCPHRKKILETRFIKLCKISVNLKNYCSTVMKSKIY